MALFDYLHEVVIVVGYGHSSSTGCPDVSALPSFDAVYPSDRLLYIHHLINPEEKKLK